MFAAEPGRAIFWATSPETDLSFIYKTAFLSLFQRAFLPPRYGYLLRALMGVKDVKGSYSCAGQGLWTFCSQSQSQSQLTCHKVTGRSDCMPTERVHVHMSGRARCRCVRTVVLPGCRGRSTVLLPRSHQLVVALASYSYL